MGQALTVTGFPIFLAIIPVLCYLWSYILKPRVKRKRILIALEENERLGMSDFEENPKRVAERWRLIRTGHREPKMFKSAELHERLSAQVAAMTPHKRELNRIRVGAVLGM